VFSALAEKHKPSIILYGATSLGRDLAPRVMVALRTGLTADAIDVGFDDEGVFYQTTPAYGGSILANIVILERRPQMVTVRPKMFVPLDPVEGAKGELIVETVEADEDKDYVVVESAPKCAAGKPIDEYDLLVAEAAASSVRKTSGR
jgi:electron transfer flavoprotein alpha subunit